jgi:hypothetical protein
MIKRDREIYELRETVFKKRNFHISAFVGFMVQIIYLCADMHNIENVNDNGQRYTPL